MTPSSKPQPDVVEPNWAPLSDLLAALMLVFMLIAILFARTVVDRASTAATVSALELSTWSSISFAE